MAHGFGNESGIGFVTARKGRERAIAGAFFLADRFDMYTRAGHIAHAAQGIEGEDHGQDAALHDCHAAPIERTILFFGLERVTRREFGSAGGHHIDMPLKNKLLPTG